MTLGFGRAPQDGVQSGASLPCRSCYAVKSAHIVPADEWQMFYSWRKDSVHSLKHIPGFMKRVKDGGRRFERNEDWLTESTVSAVPAFQMKRWFWHTVDVRVSYLRKNPSPTNYLLICGETYQPHKYTLYIPGWLLAEKATIYIAKYNIWISRFREIAPNIVREEDRLKETYSGHSQGHHVNLDYY